VCFGRWCRGADCDRGRIRYPRLAANVDTLNRDGVPWVSANDALAPVVAYVLLGMYAAVRPPQRPRRFEQLRAAVAVVALVVNIVSI